MTLRTLTGLRTPCVTSCVVKSRSWVKVMRDPITPDDQQRVFSEGYEQNIARIAGHLT